jgi:hypothetical protein
MRLDDIEEETAPRVEQYLSKIKVIRQIAHKIIDFLAQIEDFQKKLWLKKKFVVETNYCVTLDRVPEELYSEIAANDKQREEWVRLFAINEIKGDMFSPAYVEPLTVEFLKANDKLVLDTKFFEDDFKTRLIASIDDYDDQCDGVLVHSDNFRESYMLKYMLDVESRGSQTVLNIDNFDDPWNYKLLVGAGSVGETKPVKVDLVETFNWLLGLKVMHIDRIGIFQVVEGENPEEEKVLIIWRKIRDLDERDPAKIAAARQKANIDLEAFFKKQQYNTLDSEFDIIYVNGDNNLMNVPPDPDKKGLEPRYKVRLIEEEFNQLMFDVKDI